VIMEDFPDIVIYTADDARGVRIRIAKGDESDEAKRPDPSSKEFRKAAKACQDILDDIGVKLPVPPKDLPGDRPGKGDRPFPPGCGEIRQHEKGSGGKRGDEKGTDEQREDGGKEPSVAGLAFSG